MRILFASTNLPCPAASGGAQRTELLLRSLEEFGEVDCVFLPPQMPSPEQLIQVRQRCKVKLIVSSRQILKERPSGIFGRLLPGKAGGDLEAFADGGQFRWLPHAPSLEQLGDLSDYDLVVARYLQTAVTFDLFGKRPLFLDVDDYDPDRLRLRLQTAHWWSRLTIRRCLRFSETAHVRYLPQATHCWVSNLSDRRHKELANSDLLPNIPYPDANGELRPTAPWQEDSKIFLFIGTMSYSANSNGVDAFIKEAWPQVTAAYPEAKFHIAGGGIDEKQRHRWEAAKGVKVLGFLDDLRDAYAGCLASVAPITAGGGTNIKVLEAAAFGRTCILTNVAHRGFESALKPGSACLRAESIAGMADHCIALLRESDRARELGEAARRIVEEFYTFGVFKDRVRKGCEQAFQINRPSSGT